LRGGENAAALRNMLLRFQTKITLRAKEQFMQPCALASGELRRPSHQKAGKDIFFFPSPLISPNLFLLFGPVKMTGGMSCPSQ
jgi:hypothetical protein